MSTFSFGSNQTTGKKTFYLLQRFFSSCQFLGKQCVFFQKVSNLENLLNVQLLSKHIMI